MVDKVKGGVKRGCVHFDTPSSRFMKVLNNVKIEIFTSGKFVSFGK